MVEMYQAGSKSQEGKSKDSNSSAKGIKDPKPDN